MSFSRRALVRNNRSCFYAVLSRKVPAHKVNRKAGNIGSENARTRERWQPEPQPKPCYETCSMRLSGYNPQPYVFNACCCHLCLCHSRMLAAMDQTLPAPGLNQVLGESVRLAASSHMLTSLLQGPLGKLGSGFFGFLVKGWVSSPSCLRAWGTPQTQKGVQPSN